MRPVRLLALCAAGLLTAPLAGQAAAQDLPAPAPAAATALSSGETTLRGTYGSADFFVPLPAGSAARGDTTVVVEYTASPLLTDESTLTVTAGGTSLASARLGPGTTGRQRLEAVVPASLVGEEGLALGVQGFLRLTDDECEETTNPAKWVVVHAASAARLGLGSSTRNLRDVADLLVRPPLTGGGTTVVLPQDVDADLLRAAGTAAAELGRWHAQRRSDPLVGLSRTVPADGPSVVVAPGPQSPEGSALAWSGSGYGDAGDGAQGVLALSPAPGRSLLVGGADSAAVAAAADALADPAVQATLAGPVAPLTGEDVTALPERQAPWQEGAASLEQLGVDRLGVGGLGARELSFPLDRPAGWQLRDGARLDLDVEASATLQRSGSSVQVLVNGRDAGSRRLEPGGGPRTYSFDLPSGLLDRQLDGRPVRTLDLTVRFVLAAEQESCSPLQVEGVSAFLLPTSTFRLPHGDYDGRELARFPHPVAGEDGLVVVLPEDPDDDELTAGLQLAAAYGRWAEPGSGPLLLTTSDALPDDARDRGVVLLGDADAELGEALDLGRGPVDLAAGSAQAVLGLGASPLDEDRTALVVHGDGPGLLLAARALASRGIVTTLRGSRAALAGSSPPAALAGSADAVPPVELAPVLGGRWFEELRPWTIPALVLLAGLLVLLVVTARYRWRVRRPTP